MTESIIIGILSLLGTLVGAYAASCRSFTRIVCRMEQLEKKVELHNNAVERLYEVEKTLSVHEEKMADTNRRIEDMENQNNH